ncbi:MAG: hypothetical protein ACREOW_18025 [Thermodesulfobacteriota bacterium]
MKRLTILSLWCSVASLRIAKLLLVMALGLWVIGLIYTVNAVAKDTPPVRGSGTAGKIPKWIDTGTLGDSVITESSGNINITGNLTTTGDINTSTQYNIGDSRVVSIPGLGNTFIGLDAGQNNTTGIDNSFFGADAGQNNTEGFDNSFFGNGAGFSNTTGEVNSFFGSEAGFYNTEGVSNSFFGAFGAGFYNTTGSNNSFFGAGAGFPNTEGDMNSFFGFGAGLSNTTENNNTFIGSFSDGDAGITNATAIGATAQVTQSNSLVLGSINGVNSATADVSVGIGTTAPKAKLHVQGGEIFVGSAGQGVILKSPDGGTCRELTIDNTGALVLTAITCPS